MFFIKIYSKEACKCKFVVELTFLIDCAIVDFKNMTTPIFRVPHFAEIDV